MNTSLYEPGIDAGFTNKRSLIRLVGFNMRSAIVACQGVVPGRMFMSCFFLWCFCASGSLPAAAQPARDKDPVVSPYQRFLNVQAEYRGAVASGDSAQIAEKSYLMGKRYFDFGDLHEARKWFFRALKMRGENSEPEHLGKIYSRLANCEVQASDMEKAMAYARLAYTYHMRGTDRLGYYSACSKMAEVHFKAWTAARQGYALSFRSSLDSVLHYHWKATTYLDRFDTPVNLATRDLFYGEVLAEAGRFKEGIRHMKRAVRLFGTQGLKEVFNVSGAAYIVGKAYMKAGKTPEGGRWLKYAYSLIDSTNVRSYGQLEGIEEALSDYYSKTGDWRMAYRAVKNAQSFKQRQLEAYRKGAGEATELFHENEKKQAELLARENELALQRKNREIQTRLNRIGGLLVLLTGFAGIFFYRLYRKYRAVSRINAKLVKEQSHRVKNNLQSVYDMLSLQLLRLSDPVAIAALEESLHRVEAVTRVHQRLYTGERLDEVELATYIPDLVEGVLRSYDHERLRVHYAIEPIWMHADQVVAFGLILNELVTNSCKYAFGNVEAPELRISCRNENNRFIFCYEDNGPGFVAETAVPAFGMRLIRLMAGKLKGEAVFSEGAGLLFRLTFRGQDLNPTPEQGRKGVLRF